MLVPNLPGRGRDPAWAPRVTLGHLVRAAAPLLHAQAQTTVVVHSRYGVLASALAEAYPEHIRRVVYLASYMLPDGGRAADYFATDAGCYLRPYVHVSKLAVRDWLDPEAYLEGLCADCSADDVALASSLLCREQSLPALARVRLTDERYSRAPRAYIRLTEDRTLSLALQDQLIDTTGAERVESLRASHSAYFSCPDALVETILTVDR